MDFVFWGINSIDRFDIAELPVDCLANAWGEIAERKRLETNSLNYAAAIYMEFKSRREGETKLNYQQWLPYNVGSSDEVKKLSPALIEIINNLELPPQMMRDLYHLGLIPPPTKR
jgi:hypothetical protein